MNQIKKSYLGVSIVLKVANMRTAQEFTVYPYDGGDTILVQSNKRFARINLRTGKGVINAKNENYANSIKLQMNPLGFEVPAEALVNIKAYLWNNDGKNGGGSVISYENKKLYETSD